MVTNPLEKSLTDFIKPCEKLTDYIKTYDDMVDKSFCSEIIEQFESDSEHQVFIDRLQCPTFTELNISQRYLAKDVTWMSIQKQIQNHFVEAVSEYMEELDLRDIEFPPKYVFEEFRLKRYIGGTEQQFKDHVDVGDHNSARRFLVCFLYLNDVEEGGTTDFPKLNLQVSPQCGRILVFPSTWMYRHAGRPVIEGNKYILGTYLHYL